ncbi:MAG: CDP-diacylglycerol--glycerol-3-phosphate 3-phosphatidyltransferase [Gammaproteobacteria bacterium]|nr:CDP-diacylglycerol--glycerol-3-phosphate 3-phosphatidyltransferase [Gammaproteobacteria bacterium]
MFSPNTLSLLRILLIPIFVLIYIFSDTHQWIAGLLFAIASITDLLDGYLARRTGTTSRFGTFLDPTADKLTVISALVLLVGMHGELWLTLPGLIIVCRELLVSSLREWMAERQVRSQVAVTNISKAKTVVQMLAIVVLLSNEPVFNPWSILGYVMIYVATALTLWSMFMHLRSAWPVLRSDFIEK